MRQRQKDLFIGRWKLTTSTLKIQWLSAHTSSVHLGILQCYIIIVNRSYICAQPLTERAYKIKNGQILTSICRLIIVFDDEESALGRVALLINRSSAHLARLQGVSIELVQQLSSYELPGFPGSLEFRGDKEDSPSLLLMSRLWAAECFISSKFSCSWLSKSLCQPVLPPSTAQSSLLRFEALRLRVPPVPGSFGGDLFFMRCWRERFCARRSISAEGRWECAFLIIESMSIPVYTLSSGASKDDCLASSSRLLPLLIAASFPSLASYFIFLLHYLAVSIWLLLFVLLSVLFSPSIPLFLVC